MTEALDLAVAGQVLAALAATPSSVALNLSGLSVQSPAFRADLLSLLDAAPVTAAA